MELAWFESNKYKQKILEQPDEAFKYYAGYAIHNKLYLPQFYLTNDTFSVGAGDGDVRRDVSDTNWNTNRTGAGNSARPTETTNDTASARWDATHYNNTRAYWPADTSGLDDAAVISAANLNIYILSANFNDYNTSTAHLVPTACVSTATLEVADYLNYTNTSKGSLALGSMSTDASNAIPLSDLTQINKTGVTELGVINSRDLDNSAPTGNNAFTSNASENASNKPYYDVTYTVGTAWTKDLSETIVLVDTLAKKPVRTLSEVITTVDTLIKKPTRILSDTIVMVDTLTSQVITYIERLETITIVDTLTRFPQKVYSEVITTTDTLIKTVQRAFSEAVTLTDTLTNGLTAPRTLTETVSITDTLTRFPKKVLSEVIVIVDTLATNRTKNKTLTTETITLTDTLSKKPTKLLSEVITVTDSIRRHLNGLLVNLWTKIGKVTGIWTKVDKQE